MSTTTRTRRGGLGRRRDGDSLLTRVVNSVFAFLRFAEFEILFVLFFLIAFLIFKDLSQSGLLEPPVVSLPVPSASPLDETEKINEGATEKTKGGPSKCNTCRKHVGLTGFNCRCGNLFCSTNRYSDKHECPYDYKSAAQDAISKANPVVKPPKLDKI